MRRLLVCVIELWLHFEILEHEGTFSSSGPARRMWPSHLCLRILIFIRSRWVVFAQASNGILHPVILSNIVLSTPLILLLVGTPSRVEAPRFASIISEEWASKRMLRKVSVLDWDWNFSNQTNDTELHTWWRPWLSVHSRRISGVSLSQGVCQDT